MSWLGSWKPDRAGKPEAGTKLGKPEAGTRESNSFSGPREIFIFFLSEPSTDAIQWNLSVLNLAFCGGSGLKGAPGGPIELQISFQVDFDLALCSIRVRTSPAVGNDDLSSKYYLYMKTS